MSLIVARPRVESLETVQATLPEGLTLQQQVAALDLPPEVWTDGVAFIGEVRAGAEIYPETWSRIRPRPGLPVNVFIVPGGRGLNELLMPFAQLGLLAAQIAVAGLPGGAFLSAGIGLAGNFLLQQLAPKPKAAGQNKSPRQLGQAGFAGNVLKAYEQIPTVLGRKRVPPNHLYPPWVELVGDNAIVRGVVGLSGRHYGSDIRINGATSVEGVTTVFREGAESDGALQICTITAWQQQGNEMPRHVTKNKDDAEAWKLFHTGDAAAVAANDLPREVKYRIGDQPNRVVLDFQFVQGLARLDEPSSNAGCPFQFVLYAEDGSGLSFVLPQCDAVSQQRRPVRVKVVIEFAPDPGGLSAPSSDKIWKRAWANSTSQQEYQQSAHIYFGNGNAATHVHSNGDTSTLTIYCDPAVFGIRKWSLGIKVGAGYKDALIHNDGRYDFRGNLGGGPSFPGVRVDYFGANLDSGNLWAVEDFGQVTSQVALEYITSIWDEPPFDPTGLCTLEVEARNVQIDSISLIAERYVYRQWDGDSFEVAPAITSNPGDLMYEVMTDTDLNKRALNAAVIDEAAIGQLADWSRANGKECNVYIESGTVEDALNIIAEAGHAVLRRSETWGVYLDKDRSGETPVQVYSPRNSRNFQAERTFDNFPHGFTVAFDDEDDDYQTREIAVYHDDYSAATATDVVARKYPGITNEENITAKALQELRAMRLRNTVYSFETDPQWMLSPRGSLIGASSDVIDQIYGRARIVRVDRQTVDGVEKIVAVELDDELITQASTGDDILTVPDILEVPDILSLGGATGLAIQTRAGAIVTGQTTQGGRPKYITFTVPLDNSTDIVPGCMIYSGEIGQIYRDLVVINVTPGARMTARIIAVDAASGIFA